MRQAYATGRINQVAISRLPSKRGGEGRIEGWGRQEGETGEERERQKGAGGEGGVHGGGAVVLYAGQYN